jgi:hypothetical protein
MLNNTYELVPWSDFMKAPVNLSIPIPSARGNIGDNTITLQAYNGKDYAQPCSVTLTITNNPPAVSGTLQHGLLTATIRDADNDTVKYRVLLNGTVVQDWTDFKQQPYTFTYLISQKDILAEQLNTVTLQAMDDLNQMQSWTTTFTGKKFGYAFIL